MLHHAPYAPAVSDLGTGEIGGSNVDCLSTCGLVTATASEDPKELQENDCRLDAEQQSAEQQALDDPIKQEQYRQEYLRQLRLRSCPGCGEPDLF